MTSRCVAHLGAVAVAACGAAPAVGGDAVSGDAEPPIWTRQPALPEAVSNNAVTALAGDAGCELYSATGLDRSRTPAGIHARTYHWRVGTPAWERVADVPGPPVIAASAVALRGRVHLVGGYDVSATGAETSHADHRVFDPASGTWVVGRASRAVRAGPRTPARPRQRRTLAPAP